MAENTASPRLFADPYAVKVGASRGPLLGASSEPLLSESRGPLPVRGLPLLELGDPHFEADEVLGEFAGRAHLHQLFYTRSVDLSLSLCYLLRAFSEYGVEIVHGNFPS